MPRLVSRVWLGYCAWPRIAPDSDYPLRRDYTQVVLESHVEAAFSRINPHLPVECLEQVLEAVTKLESPDAIASSRADQILFFLSMDCPSLCWS